MEAFELAEISDDRGIEVVDLSHRFSDSVVLEHLTFTVAPQVLYGLVGPAGAGKTTTLRILSTLLPIREGSVQIAGLDVRDASHRIRPLLGVMFQHHALDEGSTVADNLDFYLAMRGISGAVRQQRVNEALCLFEMENMARRTVSELSWGTRRRLELARAWSAQPRILLLDEPTLGLDSRMRSKLLALLLEFRQKRGHLAVVCTHDVDLITACDAVGTLEYGRLKGSG